MATSFQVAVEFQTDAAPVEKIGRATRGAAKATREHDGATRRYVRASGNHRRALRQLDGASGGATRALARQAAATLRLEIAQDQAATSTGLLGSNIAALAKRAAAGALVVLSLSSAMAGLGSSSAAAEELRSTGLALETATGDAAESMAFVRAEADRLGIGLRSTGKDFASLAANARGTVLEGDGVRQIFLATAEASAVLGKSQEDTSGILRAFSQVAAKGRFQMEEVLQVAERGIPIFGILQRALGVTGEELSDMFQRGEIGAEALLPVARQMRQEFAEGVAAATQRSGASFQRLENQVFLLKAALGEALNPALAAVAERLAALAAQDLTVALFQGIGAAIGSAVEAFDFLARNAERASVALLALLGLGVAAWMRRTAAATHLLALAQADLATAVWAVRSGYVKLIALDVAAKLKAWAAAGATLTRSLGPLALTLGAVAVIGLSVAQNLETGTRQAQAEIDRLTASSRALWEQWDQVEQAIAAGNAELQQTEFDRVAAQAIEAQEALDRARFDVERFAGALEDVGDAASPDEIESWTRGLLEAKAEAGRARLEKLQLEEQLRQLSAALDESTGKNERERQAMARSREEAEALARSLAKLEQDRRGNEALIAAAQRDALAEAAGEARRLVSEVDLVRKALAAGIDPAQALTGEIREQLEQTILVERQWANVQKLHELQAGQLERNAELARQQAEVLEGLLADGESLIDRQPGQTPESVALRVEAILDSEEFNAQVEDVFGPDGSAVAAWLESMAEILDANGRTAEEARAHWRATWSDLGDFAVGEMTAAALHMVDAFISGSDNLKETVRSTFRELGAQLGEQLGAAFGGSAGAIGGRLVGGLLGDAVGKLLGGLFGGGDDAVARFEIVNGKLTTLVEKLEGDLGPALDSASQAVDDLLQSILSSIGGEISSAEFGLKIRQEDGEVFARIFIDGLAREFRGENAAELAVKELVARLVQTTAEGMAGITDNVRQALVNINTTSLEAVQDAIALAQALDQLQAGSDRAFEGASDVSAALVEIANRRREELELGQRLSFNLSEIVELSNQRVAALRDEILAVQAAALGATDWAAKVRHLVDQVADFNRGLEAERGSREREIATAQARAAQLRDEIATLEAVESQTDRARVSALELEQGLGGLDAEWGSQIARQGSLRRELEETEQRLAALEGSFAGLPEAIDVAELVNTVNAVASEAGIGLIDFVERIAGAQFGALERQELLANLTKAQLAAQIASVQALLAATDLLSESVRGILERVITDAQDVLARLDAGEISLASSRGGSGNRRQERERLRGILEETLAGLTGTAAAVARQRQETAELVSEMVRLNVASRDVIEAFAAMREEQARLTAESGLLDVEIQLARLAGDEEVLAELQRERQLIQLEQFRLEIEQLRIIGAIEEDRYLRAIGLLNEAEAALLDPAAATAAGNEVERLRAELEGLESGLVGLAAEIVEHRAETDAFADAMRESGAFTDAEIARLIELRGQREALLAEQGVLAIEESLARIIGDERLAAELQQARQEIELANLRLQIEQLFEIGAIEEDRYERLIELADRAGEALGSVELPANADSVRQTMADLLSGLTAAGGAAERIVAFRRGTEELWEAMGALIDAGEITLAQAGAVIRAREALEAQLIEGEVIDLELRLAQILGDQERVAELQQLKALLELENMRLQVEMLLEMGAISAETAARFAEMLAQAEEVVTNPPAPSDDAGDAPDAPSADSERARQVLEELRAGLVGAAARVAEYRAETERLAAALDDGTLFGRLLAFEMERLRQAGEDLLVADSVLGIQTSLARIIGDEDLLRRLEEQRMLISIANSRLEIEQLRVQGAITEQLYREMLALADEAEAAITSAIQDPELPPPAPRVFSGGGSRPASAPAAADPAEELRRVSDEVRRLVDSWNGLDADGLAAKARELNRSFADAERGIDRALGGLAGIAERRLAQLVGGDVGDSSASELQAALDAATGITDAFRAALQLVIDRQDLEEAFEAKRADQIAGILDQLGESRESGLVAELEAVRERFADARDALEELGATSEDFSRLAGLEADAVRAAAESMLAESRRLREELQPGGQFSAATEGQVLSLAQQNLDELLARADAGDASTLDGIDEAVEELLRAGEAFTGGAGPLFAAIREQALAALDQQEAAVLALAGLGSATAPDLAGQLSLAAALNAAPAPLPPGASLAPLPLAPAGTPFQAPLERLLRSIDQRLERLEGIDRQLGDLNDKTETANRDRSEESDRKRRRDERVEPRLDLLVERAGRSGLSAGGIS